MLVTITMEEIQAKDLELGTRINSVSNEKKPSATDFKGRATTGVKIVNGFVVTAAPGGSPGPYRPSGQDLEAGGKREAGSKCSQHLLVAAVIASWLTTVLGGGLWGGCDNPNQTSCGDGGVLAGKILFGTGLPLAVSTTALTIYRRYVSKSD